MMHAHAGGGQVPEADAHWPGEPAEYSKCAAPPPECLAPNSSCGPPSWRSEEESSTLSKQNQKPGSPRQEPGPGRSTAEQAFNDVRKEIAERNERAHQEAR